MVAKIKLADGKYCYAGPNCRLHSPTGIEAARAKHLDAMKLYTEAKSLDQMDRAKLALAEAEIAYDATTEGTDALYKIIDSNTPEFNKVLAKFRLQKAEDYVKKVEADFIKQPVKASNELVDIELNNVLSPEAEDFVKEFTPTINAGAGYLGSNEFIGSKVGEERLSNKEIKQRISADIKRAVKVGLLPGNLTYSLSMPSSHEIRIEVRGVKDSSALTVRNNPYYSDDVRPSDDAKELTDRLKLVTSAYKYDNSNSMVDHFNSTYWDNIIIEDENSRAYREKQTRLARARKIALQEEKDFVASYKANKEAAINNVVWETNNEKLDQRVGRLPGTKIFIIDQGNKGMSGISYTYLVNFGGKTEKEVTSEQIMANWSSRRSAVRSQAKRI